MYNYSEGDKMERFVNRYEELAFLEREYNRKGSSLVIIYGRRRVGKTALIREFIKNKESLYYLATEESDSINRDFFRDQVANVLNNNLLKESKLERWEPIFEILVRDRKKRIIVIDEFQNLGKANTSFPSIFQKIWDTLLKDSQTKVILCGSLISMMVEQTLSYSSPLYGRRTGQIKLGQIPFSHYHEFFTGKDLKELIERYSVTGGVPKYIELFDSSEDIETGIKNSMLSTASLLYEEPYFLLGKEVSEIGSYFSILRAIAAGHHKMGKISSFLEVKQQSLTRYLKVLMDLDILEREIPVTEKNPEKSKKGLYRLRDNYLRFWFRFVYPNRSSIEAGHAADVQDKIMKNFIDGHVAYVYEDIAREHTRSLKVLRDKGVNLNAVGRWWDKNNEIDIVGLDQDSKTIVFAECKYWEGPVGVSVLRNLQKKSASVNWERDHRKEFMVLYSINGFTDDLIKYAHNQKNIILIKGLDVE
jgi:uncharacterized protein